MIAGPNYVDHLIARLEDVLEHFVVWATGGGSVAQLHEWRFVRRLVRSAYEWHPAFREFWLTLIIQDRAHGPSFVSHNSEDLFQVALARNALEHPSIALYYVLQVQYFCNAISFVLTGTEANCIVSGDDAVR